jgi:hypothetical protein
VGGFRVGIGIGIGLGFGRILELVGVEDLEIAEGGEHFVEITQSPAEGALGFADLREIALVDGEFRQAFAKKVDGAAEINVKKLEAVLKLLGLAGLRLQVDQSVVGKGLCFHDATILPA